MTNAIHGCAHSTADRDDGLRAPVTPAKQDIAAVQRIVGKTGARSTDTLCNILAPTREANHVHAGWQVKQTTCTALRSCRACLMGCQIRLLRFLHC